MTPSLSEIVSYMVDTNEFSELRPSASEVLIEAFGTKFQNASLEQLFVLMEVIPMVTLSMGDILLGSAMEDFAPAVAMPTSLQGSHRRLSLGETFSLMRAVSAALRTLLADGEVDLSALRSSRISDYEPPSVSSVLSRYFGEDFAEATLDQKLTLMAVIAYTLRDGGEFRQNLQAVLTDGIEMPCGIATNAELPVNEGLSLIGKLHSAIVEGYSVLAANERLAN
jgi:hypothetical protein